MKILKAVLLLSAFLAVTLRLFAYENGDFLGENTAEILNITGFIAAGVCVLSALVWVLILKKEEKEKKGKTPDEE